MQKNLLILLLLSFTAIVPVNVMAATSLNTTFQTNRGTGPNNFIYNVDMQSDGKVLIVGRVTSYNGVTTGGLVRINTDGSLDTTFNNNLVAGSGGGASGLGGYTYSVDIQSDNKILVSGNFTTYGTTNVYGIARFNSDGTPDSTFMTNVGTGANGYALQVQQLQSGKILVAGTFTTFNGNAVTGVVLLNSDGTTDTSFASNLGTGFAGGAASDFTETADGKIIIMGDFTSLNGTSLGGIVRLNIDGTIDNTFSQGVGFAGGYPYRATAQSNGKLLVVSTATTYDGDAISALVRLNSDGTLDTDFGTNVGSTNNLYKIAVQADNKILVSGSFATFNGISVNKIIRLNSDGTTDTDFVTDIGTGFADGLSKDVGGMVVDSDGNIAIGSRTASFNGVSNTHYLIKLLTDIVISDATQPTVSNITSSVSNGTYIIGDIIPIQVTFSEPVLIVGSNPTLSLNVSSTTVRTATYASGSGSSTLTFSYVVQPGDVSIDLDYIDAASLNISGGNLEDAAGNHAILTLPTPGQAGSLSANKNILVDGIVPVPYTAVASGNVLTLVLDSVVSTTSVPSAGAFVVRINGNTGYTSPTTVSINDYAQITIGLSVAVQQGQNITISYSPSGSPLRDSNGNTVVAFSDFSVTNNTPASNAVVVQSGSAGYASGGGGGGGSVSVNIIYPTKQNNVNNILVSTSTKLDTLAKINNSLSTSSPIQLVKNNREVCEPYIVDAMRFGAQNNASEVIKLQKFLNEFEGEKIFVNGVYDTSTLQAVMRFQQKYSKHILFPWGLSKPTGIVSQTTRAKINALVCGKIYGCPFFTEYYRFGNSGSEVDAIKSFLNLLNPAGNLNVSSENYDMKTRREIINFQNRYKDTVLKPWGLKSATSNWYKTSVASANEIMGCE